MNNLEKKYLNSNIDENKNLYITNNYYNQISLSDFENILNETPIIKGDRAYFECPKCQKPAKEHKFNVSVSKLLFNCFSCGFKGNFKALKKHLGKYENDYNKNIQPKKQEKTSPAKKIKIDINKEDLKIFYDFLKSRLSNETLELYKTLYSEKRNLELNNDFLPLLPEDLKIFRKEHYKVYENLKPYLIIYFDDKTKSFRSSFEYRLIQFHRSFNNELDYFTGYLFEQDYQKYFATSKEYLKLLKPKTPEDKEVNSKIYGRHSLNKEQIKNNIFFIVESVDKAEALIQLGFSALGINGITNYEALKNGLLECKKKIISDNLEAIILLDSKQGIKTNETKSTSEITNILKELEINFSITNLKKPKIGSSTKDIDINDFLMKFKNPKTKEKKVNELINKKVSLEVFKTNLGMNKNLDTENIFRTAIKPKIGTKSVIQKDRLTIDEIKDNGMIKKEIDLFLEDKNNSLLILKSTAGTGKTYSLIEASKINKILYLTSNTNLIEDFINDCKIKGINSHYQKSFTQLCKDNHIKNGVDISDKNNKEIFLNQFKKYVEKGFNPNKLCQKCPLSKGCKAFSKEQQFNYFDIKNTTRIVAMTIDKFINQDKQTQDLINNYFKPELIVIDETTNLLDEIRINKQTIKQIKFYIYEKTENKKVKQLIELLDRIEKDLPKDENIKRGKNLYKYFENNYNGFKELVRSFSINDIKESIDKLELEEFLESEDIPNKKILPEFIKALKNKCENITINDNEISIFTRKDLILPENTKVIYLDANAKLNLISKELNISEDKIKLVDFKGYNPNLQIYQYLDSSSKNSALKQGSIKYENFVLTIKKNVLDEKKKTLVVVPLELENILKVDPNLKQCFDNGNLKIEHHYNLRGRNDFKDFEVVIISDTKVNHKILESRAYILYGITDFKLKHKDIQTNIFDEKTKTYLILKNSRVYQNELMNDYLKIFQADEINQCAKRIDRLGNEKKEIIIFSQVDTSKVFNEDIYNFDLITKRKKNKSKSDNFINELTNLLESNKKNTPFILKNDIEKIFNFDIGKNENYGFLIAETLVNISYGSFSYNIYNNIAKTTITNIDGTFSHKTFDNALKTAIKNTGYFEKTINLCFDGKNYIPLKFLFSNNENFSTIETILKDKFRSLNFKITSNDFNFNLDNYNHFISSISQNSIYKDDFNYFYDVGINSDVYYQKLISENYFSEEIKENVSKGIIYKLAYDIFNYFNAPAPAKEQETNIPIFDFNYYKISKEKNVACEKTKYSELIKSKNISYINTLNKKDFTLSLLESFFKDYSIKYLSKQKTWLNKSYAYNSYRVDYIFKKDLYLKMIISNLDNLSVLRNNDDIYNIFLQLEEYVKDKIAYREFFDLVIYPNFYQNIEESLNNFDNGLIDFFTTSKMLIDKQTFKELVTGQNYFFNDFVKHKAFYYHNFVSRIDKINFKIESNLLKQNIPIFDFERFFDYYKYNNSLNINSSFISQYKELFIQSLLQIYKPCLSNLQLDSLFIQGLKEYIRSHENNSIDNEFNLILNDYIFNYFLFIVKTDSLNLDYTKTDLESIRNKNNIYSFAF